MISRVSDPASDVTGSSRALLAAANMKARVVTCFRNGKQFEHGIRVSFVLGKTFPDLDHLMDHLTERCPDVQNGVRYIFTATGRMVLRLEDLEHGQSYVISGVKAFQFLPYGHADLPQSDSSNSVKSYNGFDRRKEPLKMLDIKSRSNDLLGSLMQTDSAASQLNFGSEVKVVTLVNSRHPSLRSRVILNLRTPKSFESVLRDLGDAVQMSNPKKLLNERGQEVRSFSQLRRELSKNEIFYLDTAAKGRATQDVIDHSLTANGLATSTGPAMNEIQLGRADSTSNDAGRDDSYHFGQAAMTESSPSGSTSGDADRITILSKSETPTPPVPDIARQQETLAGNVSEPANAGDRGRSPLLNSWNEGISLEDEGENSRFQVAFEEKLKSEIQKAYDVLNNDIREKKAKDESTRLVTHERTREQSEEARDGLSHLSTSSTNQDISPSTRPVPQMSEYQNSFHVVEGTDMPTKDISLLRVLGYTGGRDVVNSSIHCLASGELIYFVAGIIVIWDPDRDSQRFYCEHSRDIDRICVFDGKIVASVEQQYSSETETLVNVRIWTAATLSTETTFEESLVQQKLIGTFFSANGELMLLLAGPDSISGRIWDWRSNSKRVSTALHHQTLPEERVLAAAFHPRDEDILVTFGQQHLVLWQLIPDKTGCERKTFLAQGRKKGLPGATTVNAAIFLVDDTLLTGNTQGELVLWAPVPSEDGTLDFMQRIFHGHKAAISAIRQLGSHTVASSDFDGGIRIWNVVEGNFDLLTTAQLPPNAGSILVIQTLPNRIDELYVVSSQDQVFKARLGSATTFELMLESAGECVCLTPHPKEESFFTASSDGRVRKWKVSEGKEWETLMQSRASAIGVHPSCEVLAVACGGDIAVITAPEGVHVSLLPVSPADLSCISYSPDGLLLAAGSADGGLYFMQVADEGFSYQSLSLLRSESPITSMQWSADGQFILTNVDCEGMRDLVLWDLQNARFMTGLERIPDSLQWQDPLWSHGEQVRGMWENEKLSSVMSMVGSVSHGRDLLACGDEDGIVRLFAFPCSDRQAGFVQGRAGGGGVRAVAWLAGDSQLASVGGAGGVCVWRVQERRGRRGPER